MNNENDYYTIACKDLRYLQFTIKLPFYNNIAFQCEQIIEKLLKSIIEYYDKDNFLLMSCNILQLNDKVKSLIGDTGINTNDAKILTKYVNNTRYPGKDYITVTKKECIKAVDICYIVFEHINTFRKNKKLYIENEIDKILII